LQEKTNSMAKRLTAAQKAERAANIKAGKERAQQARDAAAALAAGTAAPAQNDNTNTSTQGDRDDAAAQEQNKRTSTSDAEGQDSPNMNVPEQNETPQGNPQNVNNDAPVATPSRPSGEPAAKVSNFFNNPWNVSAGDADAFAQASSASKNSAGKKRATQVNSPFLEVSSDDDHPRGASAEGTPSSRPHAASHPKRPFWRSSRDLTDADLAALQDKQPCVESAPNTPPPGQETDELPTDPRDGVVNSGNDEHTEPQGQDDTAAEAQPNADGSARPEVDGTTDPAPRTREPKVSNKRKRDATGATNNPKKTPKETPKKIGKKKQDALDKAEKSIRTAALAGPLSLEKQHWQERFNDQTTVDNLVAQQSEVEETAMTAANLDPLWKMCEKCSLYPEYGKY
jgi:hypothetical protein